MPEGLDILFLSGIRWEFSFQRHQQIATLLARKNRVLFFELGLSPANLLKEPGVTAGHWKRWLAGPEEIRPGLYRRVSPPILPLNRSVIAVNRFNQGVIFRSARRTWKELGMTAPIFWISDPYFSFFARDHGQRLTVFDWIHDEGVRERSRLDQVFRRLRAETLRGADLVFTPSRVIYERHGRGDPRFHLVPHGAALPSDPGPPGPAPEDISAIPSPIIGFVGTIGPAVDLELLEALAEGRKDWSFVLIGEVRRPLGGLAARPNVYLLGPKRREELPRYLSCFSAGIIPYRVSPETETVHPVKTYDYLAAGLPVISTRLAELDGLKDMVKLAAGREDFLVRLERALAGDTPELRRQRREFARNNSWDARAEQAEEIIREALAAKGAAW